MMKELLKEIEKASKSQPGLSILDLIIYITDKKYPTRIYETCYFDSSRRNMYDVESELNPKWNLSNQDILAAFKQYNKLNP